MKFYAQLNDDGLVVGISQLAGEVENEKLIPIPEFNEDLLFRKYENGNFSEEKYIPKSEPVINPIDILGQMVVGQNLTLNDVNTKVDILGQAVTQLLLKEGGA